MNPEQMKELIEAFRYVPSDIKKVEQGDKRLVGGELMLPGPKRKSAIDKLNAIAPGPASTVRASRDSLYYQSGQFEEIADSEICTFTSESPTGTNPKFLVLGKKFFNLFQSFSYMHPHKYTGKSGRNEYRGIEILRCHDNDTCIAV